MFNDDKKGKQINCDGKCFGCGGDIKITVLKTSGGYGFQNGVLCETETGQLLAECGHCYKNGKKLNPQEDYKLSPVECG